MRKLKSDYFNNPSLTVIVERYFLSFLFSKDILDLKSDIKDQRRDILCEMSQLDIKAVTHFLKTTVIFRLLQISFGLIQTKSVKKYM